MEYVVGGDDVPPSKCGLSFNALDKVVAARQQVPQLPKAPSSGGAMTVFGSRQHVRTMGWSACGPSGPSSWFANVYRGVLSFLVL